MMLERPWSELLVILMGATPLIELRGAIPLGLALNLNLGTSLIFALIGNSLVIPIVLLLLPRIIQWLKAGRPLSGFGKPWSGGCGSRVKPRCSVTARSGWEFLSRFRCQEQVPGLVQPWRSFWGFADAMPCPPLASGC